MSNVARVIVESRDIPPVVDAIGDSAVSAPAPGALKVAIVPLAAAHEAALQIARVSIESRDSPRPVDALGEGALVGASAGTGRIESRYRATGGAHEAVTHAARVLVISRDCPGAVDALGGSALTGACACARSINGGDDTFGISHEAVIHVARVHVITEAGGPVRLADPSGALPAETRQPGIAAGKSPHAQLPVGRPQETPCALLDAAGEQEDFRPFFAYVGIVTPFRVRVPTREQLRNSRTCSEPWKPPSAITWPSTCPRNG